jgi:hypothetical protein
VRKIPKWAYAVTTIPARADDLLPRTLQSLHRAGFDRPAIYVDGCRDPDAFLKSLEARSPNFLNLEVHGRFPNVRTAGHWWLTLNELFVRNPQCDRYAIFQDDLIAVKGLRAYLDRVPYEDKTYWNLYTFPENAARCSPGYKGFYNSNQLGRGALALVFDRETVIELLSSRRMVRRPTDPGRGWRAVDGGIVMAFRQVGWAEKVHSPSLVQHTGEVSSMGNQKHALSPTFPGEDFDATSLLCG